MKLNNMMQQLEILFTPYFEEHDDKYTEPLHPMLFVKK